MKGYEALLQEVTGYLAESSHNEAKLIERLNQIQGKKKDKLYQALFYVLTHLEFSEKIAKRHWEGILAHQQLMSKMLGREVSLRVALCDYFLNINKELENPIIIEIELYEQVEKLSSLDGLTGLFNRRYFETILESEISRAKRFNLDTSVLLMDIDNFKKYNDTYGHLAGDEVLKSVGQIILKSKRMIDVACRYGGEEFILILPKTSKSGAMTVGERLRKRVAALKVSQLARLHLKEPVTISGGIATFPQDANESQELIMKADKALYEAKSSGKNRISLFSIEKRQFVRVGMDQPIYYKVLDQGDQLLREGRTINMSEGGLLCAVEGLLPVASTIWIDLRFPHTSKVQSFLGGVVYAKEGNHKPPRVGVNFIRMQNPARQAISRYIRDALHAGAKPVEWV